MTYTIELYRDRAKAWRWRLVHRNGRTVADSGEGYRRRGDCWRAIARLLDTPGEQIRLATMAKTAKARRRRAA